MYYLQGLNKSQIADRSGVSRPFVNKSTRLESMDFTEDHRGWRRGKPRKWNKQIEIRILQIHNYLQSNPFEFYCGASALCVRNGFVVMGCQERRLCGLLVK